MREDQCQRHGGDVPVEVIDDVDSEGRRRALEACREQELHAHHRGAGETEGDGEVPPEPVETPGLAEQQCEQRSQYQPEINGDPENGTDKVHRLRESAGDMEEIHGYAIRLKITLRPPLPKVSSFQQGGELRK